MCSLKQLEANRRNAQKSTGPTSPEGRAIVSQNAVKHGLYSGSLLIEGEDPQELQQHVAKLLKEIAPQTYEEQILADRIIAASWKLRRLAQAEQQHHASLADGQRSELERTTPYPGEETDDADAEKLRYGSKQYHKAKALIKEQRRLWASQQTCPAGLTLAVDLQSEWNILDRFSRYEKRLESTLHRAYRELRQLRKDRASSPSPLQGEGRGEARSVPQSKASATEIETAPNKPISDATDVTTETYASAKPLPITPIPTATPSMDKEKL